MIELKHWCLRQMVHSCSTDTSDLAFGYWQVHWCFLLTQFLFASWLTELLWSKLCFERTFDGIALLFFQIPLAEDILSYALDTLQLYQKRDQPHICNTQPLDFFIWPLLDQYYRILWIEFVWIHTYFRVQWVRKYRNSSGLVDTDINRQFCLFYLRSESHGTAISYTPSTCGTGWMGK